MQLDIPTFIFFHWFVNRFNFFYQCEFTRVDRWTSDDTNQWKLTIFPQAKKWEREKILTYASFAYLAIHPRTLLLTFLRQRRKDMSLYVYLKSVTELNTSLIYFFFFAAVESRTRETFQKGIKKYVMCYICPFFQYNYARMQNPRELR